MPRRATRPSTDTGAGDSPLAADTADAATARVMDALRRLVRELSTSARGARPGVARGISGARLYVMRQIAATPGLSIGDLAARTHARQSAVSEVVGRLVDMGLVARRASTTDARQASLTLTARGRRAIAGAERTAQERLADGLAALAPAERERLAGAMEGWLAAAGLADTPPTMFFEQEAES